MKVFEYVRNGHRFGLALTYMDAAKDVGTENRFLYIIREIDIPVIFLIARQDDDWERHIEEGAVYSTQDAAMKDMKAGDTLVIAELK